MADRGWQTNKSLGDCMYHMLRQQIDCDVTFRFRPDNTTFGAHKYMLKARSPVFEAMLSGNLAESSAEVEIVDIEPAVFKQMLTFMYTDKADVNCDNVFKLLQAAKKYLIDRLAKECSTFLENNVDETNVCEILNGSLVYDQKTLAQKCLDLIGPKAYSIVNSPGFWDLSQEALCKLLQSNALIVPSEIVLFNACVGWATMNYGASHAIDGSAIRAVLGKCLFQIRFAQIPPPEFAASIGSESDVLTPEEKNCIYTFMLTGNDTEKQRMSAMGFNITPRKAHFTKVSLFQKPPALDDMYLYGRRDGFAFKTNCYFLFNGVGVYGRDDSHFKEKLTLQLWNIQKDHHQMINTVTNEIENVNGPQTRNVMFSNPLTIDPGELYAITLSSCVEGGSTYSNQAHFDSVKCNDISLDFYAFDIQTLGSKPFCQHASLYLDGEGSGLQRIGVYVQGRIAELYLTQL